MVPADWPHFFFITMPRCYINDWLTNFPYQCISLKTAIAAAGLYKKNGPCIPILQVENIERNRDISIIIHYLTSTKHFSLLLIESKEKIIHSPLLEDFHRNSMVGWPEVHPTLFLECPAFSRGTFWKIWMSFAFDQP